MIIVLAIIGFAALVALVVYLPYRRTINRWFAEKKYRRHSYVYLAAVIALVAFVLTLVFVFSTDKSEDAGIAERAGANEVQGPQFVPEIGAAIPDIVLPNTENEELKLSDYQDKTIVLTFSNTWCKYCSKQLPVFIELRDELGEDAQLFLVNMNEPLDVVKQYKEDQKIDVDILVDANGEIGSLFQVRGTPTSYLVKQGMVCGQVPGAVELADMVDAVAECNLIIPDEEINLNE